MGKLISAILTLLLLAGNVGTDTGVTEIKNIGDYVRFGKYNDEPILWRYVADDENGKLFLSDKILCYKEFDSVGDVVDVETKGSHSRNSDRGIYRINLGADVSEEKKYTCFGSSYWGDSNIRSWLRSDEDMVTWLCGCPPENEDFRNERGFLHNDNFSLSEKSVIKNVELPTLLTDVDADSANTQILWEDSSDKLFLAQKQNETVFLLSKAQYKEIEANSSKLGEYLIFSDPNKSYRKLSWWLRDPNPYISGTMPQPDYGITAMYASIKSEFDADNISYIEVSTELGIRPAFYLNEETAQIVSGDGSRENPYILDGHIDE